MNSMNDFVLPPHEAPSIPVAGTSSRFPVRRIYCVGQNYAAHAREMGQNPDRNPPFFFSKPADAVLSDGRDLPYPPQTGDLHYEAELIVAIGKAGRDINADAAKDHIWGYAAGVDFTRRDLQAEAKKSGRPWDMAKGFDHSAACGVLHSAKEIGEISHGAIRLSVDGEIKQDGDLRDMIWSVPEIIAHLSQFVTLAAGDLIYTGTPSGVGPVVSGQSVLVEIEGLTMLNLRVLRT